MQNDTIYSIMHCIIVSWARNYDIACTAGRDNLSTVTTHTHIIHNTYNRFGTKPIFADVYYQYYHYYYYHLSIAIAFSFSFYFPDPQEWLWHHQIIIKSASHVLCIDNIDTLEFRMWLLESSSLLSFEMDFLFLCICYDVHYTLLCYEIDEK